MTITRAHITRRAARDGVPAKAVERDYALAHAVAAIADANSAGHLIFKGGAALRLIHFDDYRYSGDLDFSVQNAAEEDAMATIRAAFEKPRTEGPRLRLTADSPARIAYLGPLDRERTMKLDLADDEHVVHTARCALLPYWSDLPAVEVLAYTPLEIAAEKLRCVLQRLQCRDLFDLHVLFTRAKVDVNNAAELFAAKASHRGFDPASFAEKYRARIAEYGRRWETELSEHVPHAVPNFNGLEREVSRFLRSAGLL